MASSTLKLVIQKGPRSGETLEFTPKSTVRIGRVVRGNNLPIKDSGISSKHLTIEFNSDNGKWVITDLDSSNGTIVNFNQLKPLSPFEICHGDEIKIGELTSFRVYIVEIGEKFDDCRNPKNCGKAETVEMGQETGSCRNPRTRGATRITVDSGVSVEISEENNNRRNLRNRASSKRAHEDCLNLEEESVVRDEEENVEGNQRRLGRGRPPKKSSNLEEGNVEGNQRGRGRGRPPKKASNLEEENVEGNRRGRGRGRPPKASNLEDGKNVEVKSECGVSTRRTRSSKRKEDELLGGVEAPVRQTRSKKNVEDAMDKMVERKVLDMDDSEEVFGSKEPDMDVLDLEKGAGSTKNDVDVMKKAVESKGLDMGDCKEVESISKVKNGRAWGSHAECLENVQDAIPKEEVNQEQAELDVPEKMVLIRGKVRVRNTKDAEDLMTSSVMEKVVESKGWDMEGCKEVESISKVKNGKARESLAECLENVEDAVPVLPEEENNQENSEQEVPEKVLDLMEQPCEESVDDAFEKNVLSDMMSEEFIEVVENVQDAVLEEKIHQEVPEKVVDLKEQPCEESVTDDLEKIVHSDMKNEKFMEVEEDYRDSVLEEEMDHEANVDVDAEDVIKRIVESKSLDLDNGKEVSASKDPEMAIVPDLEKMTLGDWFDYLEVYLPKQIYAATDQIIEDMRKQATQFNDFMLQQQKEKSKLPLARE